MTDHRPEVREALSALFWCVDSFCKLNKDADLYFSQRGEIDQAERALSAPPIEPVVEEVVEVSQLGFCSARLRDMGLTSSDRIRVVGWTTEAQGGV